MSLSDSIVGILKRIKGDASKRGANIRTLSALTAKEKLASVLAEISETVLPRALTFKIGDQASLSMDTSGRRLLRIIKIEPDPANRSGDIAFATRNDTELKKQVAAISELLAAFVKTDGALVVTSGEPGTVYSPNEAGFSEQELREACDKLDLSDNKPGKTGKTGKTAGQGKTKSTPGKAGAAKAKPAAKIATGAAKKKKPAAKAKPADPGKTMKAFLDANTSLCTGIAIISPDGSLKSSTGAAAENPDWAQIAKDICADMNTWTSATGDFIGTEQLVILKSPGLGDQSMCYLYLNGHIVAAIFRNSDLARILSSVSRILNWNDTP